MDMGPCRGCGVQMLWAVSINGRKQPIDPKPDPDKGNLILIAAENEAGAIALHIGKLTEEGREAAERNGVNLYTAHHYTCPARKRFTRERTKQ